MKYYQKAILKSSIGRFSRSVSSSSHAQPTPKKNQHLIGFCAFPYLSPAKEPSERSNMKHMQKRILQTAAVAALLLLSLSTNAQVFGYRLKMADSLYGKKQYTQSLELYREIFNERNYSPAMLLRMAYIEEGLSQNTLLCEPVLRAHARSNRAGKDGRHGAEVWTLRL